MVTQRAWLPDVLMHTYRNTYNVSHHLYRIQCRLKAATRLSHVTHPSEAASWDSWAAWAGTRGLGLERCTQERLSFFCACVLRKKRREWQLVPTTGCRCAEKGPRPSSSLYSLGLSNSLS